MEKTSINFRLPQVEADLLAKYAQRLGRTRTEIVREFIRSLAAQIPATTSKSRKGCK
jgi:hypothetical protein